MINIYIYCFPNMGNMGSKNRYFHDKCSEKCITFVPVMTQNITI